MTGVYLAIDPGSTRTHNMNGGALNTPLIESGRGTAAFNFNGGVIDGDSYTQALTLNLDRLRVANANKTQAAFSPLIVDGFKVRVLELGSGTNSNGSFQLPSGTNTDIGALNRATGIGSQATLFQVGGRLEVTRVVNGQGVGALALDNGATLSSVDVVDVDCLNVARGLANPGVVTPMQVSAGPQVDVGCRVLPCPGCQGGGKRAFEKPILPTRCKPSPPSGASSTSCTNGWKPATWRPAARLSFGG